MLFLGKLADVDVPTTELERPGHGLLLLLEGLAGQIEVNLVRPGLLLLARNEPQPEPGVVTRQQRHPAASVVDHLPAENAGPETRDTGRIVRIERQREKLRSHPDRISDPHPPRDCNARLPDHHPQRD